MEAKEERKREGKRRRRSQIGKKDWRFEIDIVRPRRLIQALSLSRFRRIRSATCE